MSMAAKSLYMLKHRVLIKSKNERFAEKKSVKKRNKLFAEPVPYSDALKALVPEVEAWQMW